MPRKSSRPPKIATFVSAQEALPRDPCVSPFFSECDSFRTEFREYSRAGMYEEPSRTAIVESMVARY
jgi:hypothetical protein